MAIIGIVGLFLLGIVLWVFKWVVIVGGIVFFLVLFTPEEYFERFNHRLEVIIEDLKEGEEND